MKKLILTVAIITASILSSTAFARGHRVSHASRATTYGITHVHAYTKKNGTHVAGYDRTTPDHTRLNNWSTKGNVNPETGKKGTKSPYGH